MDCRRAVEVSVLTSSSTSGQGASIRGGRIAAIDDGEAGVANARVMIGVIVGRSRAINLLPNAFYEGAREDLSASLDRRVG